MNWGLIISVLTALGLFEILKKIFNFSVENNLIKRNLEIREIANRVLEWSSWLKFRNFEQPLPLEISNQLYIDIFKIQDIDKKLSEDIMRLINFPQMNAFLYKNLDKQPGNMDIIHENCKLCHDMTDKLNKKCNKLRYQPILEIQLIINKLKSIKSKK
jgi:hypothetical protein